MKSASNRSNYRYNPCKRRRPSFDKSSTNNNTPTLASTLNSALDSSSGSNEDVDNNACRSSLTRVRTINNDSSGVINAPLNFDSTLKVCIEKIRTDLIFTPSQVTSIRDVTPLVTEDDSDNMTQSDTDTVTPHSTEERMDLCDNSNLLIDTIPHSTSAQKEARRAKRRLQLEQWRQYELNRARNERYQNRLKRKHGISFAVSSSQQKTIKWKKELVQIFIVDCETQA